MVEMKQEAGALFFLQGMQGPLTKGEGRSNASFSILEELERTLVKEEKSKGGKPPVLIPEGLKGTLSSSWVLLGQELSDKS